MNFDFIKDLEGLNKAFPSCENAEELARSMPDLSMVASRKSAEVIAKFVYLVAHSERVEDLTFADILSDYAVRDYLNNKSVLDAFHFIRKNGNTAVHTLTQSSSDTAIDVLAKLHFVVGEVAKRMMLIARYPRFNPDIAYNPNAAYYDIKETGNLAREMYDDYVISQNQADQFLKEFNELSSPYQFIPGDVDLNETIEFNHKPLLKSTIAKIQEHFGFLALQKLKNLREDKPERNIDFSADIKLLGENGYAKSDLLGFMNALMSDLPNADGFSIKTKYHGPSVSPVFNTEVREDFFETVTNIGTQERFTYTIYSFSYNGGSGNCGKYQNGEWVDLEKAFTCDIVKTQRSGMWFCWNVNLVLYFDFEKHAEILAALQNAVRKYVPENELQYCEQAWADGDVHAIINGVAWDTNDLSEVQDFLDEVNLIIMPIQDECEYGTDGIWFYTDSPFAEATWDWTDEGFKVIGVEL